MTFAIISLIALILISAFFSGSETSMMAVNRYRIQHKAKKGNRSAKRILTLLARPDRLLGIILIGNTFANVLASSLATIIALNYWGEKSTIIASIILTFVLLIFAEVTPKTLAALHPESYSKYVSWPLNSMLKIAYPLVWLINLISNGLLAIFKIKHHHQPIEALSHEELRSAVLNSAKNLSSKDKAMLIGIFDLKDACVNDIMVPRNNIHGIELDSDVREIKKVIGKLQHNRVPIYQNSIDNICGVLHLREAVKLIGRKDFNKSMLLKASHKPYFIPEKVSLVQQLLGFQKHKERLAFIVDEYGKVEGLIKLDDILEKIVGEFTTDSTETSKAISSQKNGSYLVDGSVPICDLNRDLNLKLPIDEAVTLSGLIIEHLESIPKAGATVEINKCKMEVMHIKHHQIKTVRVTPKPASSKKKKKQLT